MTLLDDARAHAANTYMADCDDLVQAHEGAAYAESVILSRLVAGTASGPTGLLGDAYLSDLGRRMMEVPDRGHAYSLTHAIMFGTDFGRHPVSLPGYGALLDSLLSTYATDTDVLGELLVSAKCIGYWSSAMDTALTAFTNQWDALDKTSGGFAQTYHSVLVGGLLFAMVV